MKGKSFMRVIGLAMTASTSMIIAGTGIEETGTITGTITGTTAGATDDRSGISGKIVGLTISGQVTKYGRDVSSASKGP